MKLEWREKKGINQTKNWLSHMPLYFSIFVSCPQSRIRHFGWKIATQRTRYSELYKKTKQNKTKQNKKHGWTALDIVGAGSSKFKGIQGRFYLLYPFRLNGESAREHQGALILGLWKREVKKGCLVPSYLACSRVAQSPLRLGRACGGGRNKGKEIG